MAYNYGYVIVYIHMCKREAVTDRQTDRHRSTQLCEKMTSNDQIVYDHYLTKYFKSEYHVVQLKFTK